MTFCLVQDTNSEFEPLTTLRTYSWLSLSPSRLT